MAQSFISQLGRQTAEHAIDKLHRVAQQRAADLEMKPRRDTLNKFFPEDVSNLILQLPERDQWSAIQQLAQGYGTEQGGNQDQELEQIREQGQLGPQGSNAVDQQLQQAMGGSRTQESQGMPLAQQVQQPAVGNQEFAQQQEQGQGQRRQRRPTLGEALGGGQGGQSKEQMKAASEYVNTEREKYKDSKGALNALSRMESYNNSNRLSNPLWASAIKVVGAKGYGPDLSSLLTPESQDYEKTATGFLKYAKQYFGSRMTEGELNTYLKTIPTLTNSKAGRKILIESSKDLVQADQIFYKAMEGVIAENGGRIPENIQQLAEQRAAPQLDKIYEKFRNPLLKQASKDEHSVIGRLIQKHPPHQRKVGQKYSANGVQYENTGKTYRAL